MTSGGGGELNTNSITSGTGFLGETGINGSNTITYVTSQSDLQNWDGISNLYLSNDFTITYPYIQPIIYGTNLYVNGRGYTITIDVASFRSVGIYTWGSFFLISPGNNIYMYVTGINLYFTLPMRENGLILLNSQSNNTYIIDIHFTSIVMVGAISSYFVT